jgi:hypothetical protein
VNLEEKSEPSTASTAIIHQRFAPDKNLPLSGRVRAAFSCFFFEFRSDLVLLIVKNTYTASSIWKKKEIKD